jgi:hypothetical protein
VDLIQACFLKVPSAKTLHPSQCRFGLLCKAHMVTPQLYICKQLYILPCCFVFVNRCARRQLLKDHSKGAKRPDSEVNAGCDTNNVCFVVDDRLRAVNLKSSFSWQRTGTLHLSACDTTQSRSGLGAWFKHPLARECVNDQLQLCSFTLKAVT